MIESTCLNQGSCSSYSQTKQNTLAFTIKRHDTCPKMEIDVKGRDGQVVDLEGWSAIGIMFYTSKLYADLVANSSATTVDLESVVNVKIGDTIRFEKPDATRELALVTAVNRQLDQVTVTRGYGSTNIVEHHNNDTVVGIRADNIPITISKVESPDPNDLDETILTRSYLVVNWRSSDTIQSGDYLLEVKLTGPNGEQMSLPRIGGFSVHIPNDSEDV